MNFVKIIQDKIKKRSNYDILTLFLTAVLLMIGFSLAQRMFFSKFTIMLGDMYTLYIPIYRMLINKILYHNDLFGAGSLFYAANAGLGLDVSAYICGQSFLSPFNIILFFIKDDNLAACFIIVSKYAFAAFFFQRYLRKVHQIDGLISVCWSVAYAMCGYCTLLYINIHFLDGVVFLPWIMTLCYETVKYKKGNIRLVIAYYLVFTNGVYPGYIVGIFSFLYWLALLLTTKTDKKILIAFNYFKSVFLAFLVSAFLLVTTAYSLLSTLTSDRTVYNGSVANIFDIICNLYIGMNQGLESLNPYIYSGIIILILVPLFFINKKIDNKTKIVWGGMFAFIWLCMIVPFLYIAMHCFDNPDTFTYRFTYLVSFTVISIAAIAFDKIDKYNWIAVAVISVVVICFYGYMYFIKGTQSTSYFGLEVNAIFIALYAAILLLRKKYKKKIPIILSVIMMMELLLNFYMVSINERYAYLNYKEIVNDIESKVGGSVNQIKNSDNGIYRIYIPNSPSINYQFTSDTLRAQFFGSTENEKVRNTIYRLGMLTSARLLTDYGICNGTELILGYKYNIYSNGVVTDQDIDVPIVEQNKYFLGLGYMTSSEIVSVDIAESENAFENINTVLSAMTGDNVRYFEPVKQDINLVFDGTVSEPVEYDYNRVTLDEGVPQGFVYFTFEGDGQYYAYIPFLMSSYRENTAAAFSIGGDIRTINLGQNLFSPKLIKLGKDDEGLNNLYIQIDATDLEPYFFYKDIFVYKENIDELERTYNKLKDNMFEFEVFEDGYIKGYANATEELNTLFLAIDYDERWQLLVDGKPHNITPGLDHSFITINLEPGRHEVELKYVNPYITYGAIITLIGLMLFAIDIMLYFRSKKKVNTEIK